MEPPVPAEPLNDNSDPYRLSVPHLTVHLVSLFPSIFDSWLKQGVVSRAVERGVVALEVMDLRPFGIGRHKVTDDYPFGGGPGMVMKPEPLYGAIEALRENRDVTVILTSPRGRRFDQRVAGHLARLRHLALIAGHYEGVDERIRRHMVDDEISIGDFVLSCGEIAAMVIADAVVRLVPGVLAEGSALEESFSSGLLEYPHFTRPAEFQGWNVPDVLLSGHHGEIARWRRRQALRSTFERRPDLLKHADLLPEEYDMVQEWSLELSHVRPNDDEDDTQPTRYHGRE